MLVKYNSLSRVDKPLMTLCNPGSVHDGVSGRTTSIVGPLPNTEADEIIYNFNAPSELNFRIYRVITGDDDIDAQQNEIFNGLESRRLILLEGIGYFVITSVKTGYSEGAYYKDVSAQSSEVELQQRGIPPIEDGTYSLLTQNGKKGILDIIAEAISPLWSVYHVDDSLKEKLRTFEDVDPSLDCLSFLTGNVQEAYECVVIFNPLLRRVEVYDQESFADRTPIQISVYDFIDTLEISENAEDIYTAMNVRSTDDTGISSVNPIGTNIIYNFEHYLPWMSASLRSAVEIWQHDLAEEQSMYININRGYYDALTEKTECEAEIERLELLLQLYNRLKDNMVAGGDLTILNRYNTAISQNGGATISSGTIDSIKAAVNAQIAVVNQALETERTRYGHAQSNESSYWHEISRDNLMFGFTTLSSYFTPTQVEELKNFMFECSYTDEYVAITEDMSYNDQLKQMEALYERGKKQLARVSQPNPEFTIDSESGVFAQEFQQWSDELETGRFVDIAYRHTDTEDEVATLFLSSITINYDEQEMALKFSGQQNRSDPKALFDKVLGKINKSANSVNFINNAIAPVREGQFDEMRDKIEGSRNITIQEAFASENEEIVIDGSGITGKKFKNDGSGGYEPQQIKITSQNIVFTKNAWLSAETAIGKLEWEGEEVYGINGEAIIGNILIGENVFFKNQDNSIVFDNTGLTLQNSYNSIRIFPGDNGDSLLQISDISDPIHPKSLLNLTNSGSLYLNPGVIQAAWNDSSGTVRLESMSVTTGEQRPQLNIYRDYIGPSNYSIITSFDQDGCHFYDPDTNEHIATMGSSYVSNASGIYGLGFYLDDSSSFIQWSYQDPTDGQYEAKLEYFTHDIPGSGYSTHQGFHFEDNVFIHGGVGIDFYSDLNMHDHAITNAVITNNSDARLKQNIRPYSGNAIETVSRIGISSFDWIETGAHEDIGFIAQQLRDVIPDAVSENEETGRLYVKPIQLIPYLVGAIQDLYKLIKEEKE